MIIQALPSGPFSTNAYVIGCEETRQAAIIDPGVNSADKIIAFLNKNNLTPTKIILTHSHWDHTGNAAILKEKLNIPIYIHPLDTPNLESPGADQLPMMVPVKAANADHLLNDNDTVSIGNLLFTTIYTPGHTPGCICLYCPKENVLISGDTLFKESIGNLSFPTCQPEKMWDSLKKLEVLPPETRVFPGHGPSTTIGQESWLPKAKEIFDRD